MTSFPAAMCHPNEGARNNLPDGPGPAPVRRECHEHSPGPVPAVDPYTVETLRDAQTLLDQVPSCDAKGLLRMRLDGLQRSHGGADEWGRRADGSRPSEDRKERAA